jgi:hypothetical protein
VRIKKSIFAAILAVTEMVRIAVAQSGAIATVRDAAPVAIPADVQMEPLLSSAQGPAPLLEPATMGTANGAPISPGMQPVPGPYVTPAAPTYYAAPAYYAAPMAPGVYTAVPASGNDYSGVVQPDVTMGPPCEAVACDNGPWSKWYFGSYAVAFGRDNYSRKQGIAGDFSTDDLEFNGTWGPYLTLGYCVDPNNQWQLIYFNSLGMSADARIITGIESTVNYDSNFHSAEFNYLYTWTHWSLLAGFRYLHLDEQFSLHQTNFINSSDLDMDTANDLYGGQLGFTYHREWRWLTVDVVGKFGVYGNAAVQHGGEFNNGVPVSRFTNNPSAQAQSGELDFFFGHRFSPHWTGQLGLIVLEVDNVALAPDMDISNKADGNITLTGISVGGMAQW